MFGSVGRARVRSCGCWVDEHDVDGFQLTVTSSRLGDVCGQSWPQQSPRERRGFGSTGSRCSDATESLVCSFLNNLKTRWTFSVVFKRAILKWVAGMRVPSFKIVKI